MKQQAFLMKLKLGCLAEYRKRHDAIASELVQTHSEHGIRDYTIFCDEKNGTLFAVRRLADNHSADTLRSEESIRRWWTFNADLMECHPDGEPITWELTEVFHMD